jgi:hypothetical protein
MLRVTVELWPGGREAHKRELAVMHISNMGVLAGADDYAIAVVAKEDVNPVAQRGRWESRGMIFHHDREQSVFALLTKAAAWAAKESEKH